MDDISNDGLNSELEDDEDEDDFQVNNITTTTTTNNNNNQIRVNNTDDDNNNLIISNYDNNNKTKRLNSINKHCKKRKCRTTFTKSQLITLENEFLKSNFVSSDRIELLIEITGLDSRIIKNWFKNKRSRVLADSKGACRTSSDTQSVCSSINQSSSSSSSSSIIETNNSPLSLINQSNQLYIQTSNLILVNEKVPLKSSNLLNQELDQLKNPVNIEIAINNSNNNNNDGLLNIINKNEDEIITNLKSINNSPPLINPKVKCNNELIIKKQNFLNHLEWLKDSSCNVCSRFSKLFCICNVSKTALSRLYKNYVGFNSSIFYQDHKNHNYSQQQQRCIANSNENESKVFEIL